MSVSGFLIAPGVTIEEVGDEYLVLLRDTGMSLHVDSESSQALRKILEGCAPGEYNLPVLRTLVERGVLVEEGPQVSRRGVIRGGAIGAVSGLAVLSLPSVAAASSTSDILGAILGIGTEDDTQAPDNLFDLFPYLTDNSSRDEYYFILFTVDPTLPALAEGLQGVLKVPSLGGSTFDARCTTISLPDFGINLWAAYVPGGEPGSPVRGDGSEPFEMTFTDANGARFRVTQGFNFSASP